MAIPMFNTTAIDTEALARALTRAHPQVGFTRPLVDGLVDHNWLMTLAQRRAGGAPLFDVEKREQTRDALLSKLFVNSAVRKLQSPIQTFNPGYRCGDCP